MGIWHHDDRTDISENMDEQVKENAKSVVAICAGNTLIREKVGIRNLRVKRYGETYNLCNHELFHHQPAVAGRISTGFLVGENLVATAGYCVDESNLTDLRFVFGYSMLESPELVTQIPNENIYKGAEIVQRVYHRKGNLSNWALVRLKDKVLGHPMVRLSKKKISLGQPVYAIGYPCGLPSKYVPGAYVRNIHEAYFVADLDTFSGNGGSPVFASDTHEVLGIVVRGDNRDFRWNGKCWLSIIYPDYKTNSEGAHCTMGSEFINYCG